jgi:gluconate kinase
MADGVLINGVYGCGKSTVAAEIADQLERRDISYAALDLDWLTWFEAPGLDDDSPEQIFLDNLAGVVGNYLRVGVQHFVLAGSVRDRDALDRIRVSIPVPLRVVRLEVPIDVIDRRLLADPTEGRRGDLRVAMTWLTDGTGAGLEDLAVNNEQPIAEVARAIIEWLGWAEPGLTPADPSPITPPG